MDSFLFSVQATAPVFLLMVLGYLFRRLGLLNDQFCKVSDKFVFTAALPVMLFRDMATTHLRETFDLRPAAIIRQLEAGEIPPSLLLRTETTVEIWYTKTYNIT